MKRSPKTAVWLREGALPACAAAIAAAMACRVTVFECSSDAQCGEGICAAGYCAFEDPECTSGHRYGSHGPQGLAGYCVPPNMDDTTSNATGETSVDDTAAASTSTGGGDAPGSTGTSTTVAVDDSSGDAATSGLDSSSDDGSMRGPPCMAQWEDDFEGAALDPTWEQWIDGDPGTVSQVDGVALFSLPVTADGWVSIYRQFGAFEGQSIVAEVASPPSDENAMAWLEVSGPTKYELVIHDGMLQARVGAPSSPEVVDAIAYEPRAHRFLRMRASQGDVTWSASSDGQTWVEIHASAGTNLDGDYILGFGLGTELALPSETQASLQHIYRCLAD